MRERKSISPRRALLIGLLIGLLSFGTCASTIAVALWTIDRAACKPQVADLSFGTVNVPVGATPTAMAGRMDTVWVVSAADGSLRKVSVDGTVRGPWTVGRSPSAIVHLPSCHGADHLWIALKGDDAVVEVDAESGRILLSIPVPAGPAALASDPWATDTLWVASEMAGSVSRIDTKLGVMTATFPAGHGPRSLAVDPDQRIYVADYLDNAVSVIDSRNGATVAQIAVGQGPVSVEYDLGFTPPSGAFPSKVWVADQDDRTVVKIDPATRQVSATWPVPGTPVAVIPIGARAWAVGSPFGLYRIDDSPDHGLGPESIRTDAAALTAITVGFSGGDDFFWIGTADGYVARRTSY